MADQRADWEENTRDWVTPREGHQKQQKSLREDLKMNPEKIRTIITHFRTEEDEAEREERAM
jgi:hypothetical protein